jgi:hypothetical protein
MPVMRHRGPVRICVPTHVMSRRIGKRVRHRCARVHSSVRRHRTGAAIGRNAAARQREHNGQKHQAYAVRATHCYTLGDRIDDFKPHCPNPSCIYSDCGYKKSFGVV